MGTQSVFIGWKIDVVKMAVVPKLNCRYSRIPIKILLDIFVEVVKQSLKFIRKYKGPRVAETILKTNKIGDLPYLILKFTVIYSNQDSMVGIRLISMRDTWVARSVSVCLWLLS